MKMPFQSSSLDSAYLSIGCYNSEENLQQEDISRSFDSYYPMSCQISLQQRDAMRGPQVRIQLNINRMRPNDAVELLRKTMGIGNGDYPQLAQALEYDFRSLFLAAHYLKKHQATMSVGTYIKEYYKQLAALTSQKNGVPIEENRTNAILQLSLKSIGKENAHAIDLLHFFSYLNSESISYSIIETWANQRDLSAKELLALLKDYSLIVDNDNALEIENRIFSIASDLQHLMQQAVPHEEDKETSTSIEAIVLHPLLQCLKSLVDPSLIPHDLPKKLSPHLRSALAHVEKRGIQNFKIVGDTHTALGILLQEQEKLEEAQHFFTKAIQCYKKIYLSNSTTSNLHYLSRGYMNLSLFLFTKTGEKQLALKFLQGVIEFNFNTFMSSDSLVDSTFLNLRISYRNAGHSLVDSNETAKAQEHFHEVITFYKLLLELFKNHIERGTLDPSKFPTYQMILQEYALIHNTQGMLYTMSGNGEKAQEYFDYAIQHYETFLSTNPENPSMERLEEIKRNLTNTFNGERRNTPFHSGFDYSYTFFFGETD